ncbi:hypothetical protein [Nocardia salmonicida]|uniref:hypothetical protein n=1 Tax=Nocardia salmonicida TaxID=53431 RepID=UPI0033C81267
MRSLPKFPLDLHADIDVEIGRLVLREMYEDDDSADLLIGVKGDQYGVTLKSTLQPIIFPDDDLLESVGKLVSLHIEYGTRHLRAATYHYEKEQSGSWIMSANFDYDPA